jgi:hypothetical protein
MTTAISPANGSKARLIHQWTRGVVVIVFRREPIDARSQRNAAVRHNAGVARPQMGATKRHPGAPSLTIGLRLVAEFRRLGAAGYAFGPPCAK